MRNRFQVEYKVNSSAFRNPKRLLWWPEIPTQEVATQFKLVQFPDSHRQALVEIHSMTWKKTFSPIALSPSENTLIVGGASNRIYFSALNTPLVRHTIIRDGSPNVANNSKVEKQYTGSLTNMIQLPALLDSAQFLADEQYVLLKCSNARLYVASAGEKLTKPRVINLDFGYTWSNERTLVEELL